MPFGSILCSCPPIVENIFVYLSFRDLNSCSRTCKLWNRLALIEKSHRKNISDFLQIYNCTIHSESHPKPCDHNILPLEVNLLMLNHLQEQIHATKNEPQFCLAFVSESVISYAIQLYLELPNAIPNNQPRKRRRVQLRRKGQLLEITEDVFFKRFLPKDCGVGLCASNGVVGTHSILGPFGYLKIPAISGLLFPKLSGLDIYTFAINKNKPSEIANFLPHGKNLKCVLLFFSKQTAITIPLEELIGKLMKDYGNIAIGGEIIETCSYVRDFAVAFTGDNVQATSIVLGPIENSELQEAELKVFEESGLLSDQCIALMFASFAHSESTDDRVKDMLFCKMYPNIPLFGIYGKAQIGTDFAPHKSESPLRGPFIPPWICPEITVFLMISVKK